jgi:hypothetical protein
MGTKKPAGLCGTGGFQNALATIELLPSYRAMTAGPRIRMRIRVVLVVLVFRVGIGSQYMERPDSPSN